MGRIASALLVVGLLVGTAAAFGITERLKLVRSPIAAPRVDKIFSPVCDCGSDTAGIAFRLRESDTLTLTVVDGDGEVVRTLVASGPVPAGRVEARWDGLDDAGQIAPEGRYRPQVHLADQRRTIVLPNPIRVDTTAPSIRLVRVRPRSISPDGDGRSDRVRVTYETSERAHALLYVDEKRRVRTRGQRRRASLQWFGTVGGRALPSGGYRLALAAEDPAGNVSRRTASVLLRVRYVELGRDVVRVRARTRFGVRVESDAPRVRWRFAGRTGSARPGLLVLRAPRTGRYTLFVQANGHGAKTSVIVRPRGR